jgi:hypothetical protein
MQLLDGLLVRVEDPVLVFNTLDWLSFLVKCTHLPLELVVLEYLETIFL